MRKKKRHYIAIALTAPFILNCLIGCGSATATPESTAEEETGSDAPEYWFDLDTYRDNLSGNRIAITEYREQYEADAASLCTEEYVNLDFSDCVFEPFPESEDLSVMTITIPEITTAEAWEMIENWLSYAGQEEEVDLKTDVIVVSERLGTLGTDENAEYYPFYDNLSSLGTLQHGEGAFLSTDTAYMGFVDGGINAMSTGKISSYLNNGTTASADCFGGNTADVVTSGAPDELGTESYPLPGGLLSIREGAALVNTFYASGILFPAFADGVSNTTRTVNVFRLGNDVYGYDYQVSRTYKGVPFVWNAQNMNYFYGGSWFIEIDEAHAYVVDSTGIAASYSNYIGSNKVTALLTETDLISLSDIAAQLSQELALQASAVIKNAKLVYVRIDEPDADHEVKYVLPCWHFSGQSMRSDEEIEIFVDALTGTLVSCYGVHD
ncbi:MAG: hypothetical protein LIO96_10585 [Lachnospiraceae bacterium]|nr:hypothetical protein [Lachnospiraceae bacterium]